MNPLAKDCEWWWWCWWCCWWCWWWWSAEGSRPSRIAGETPTRTGPCCVAHTSRKRLQCRLGGHQKKTMRTTTTGSKERGGRRWILEFLLDSHSTATATHQHAHDTRLDGRNAHHSRSTVDCFGRSSQRPEINTIGGRTSGPRRPPGGSTSGPTQYPLPPPQVEKKPSTGRKNRKKISSNFGSNHSTRSKSS